MCVSRKEYHNLILLSVLTNFQQDSIFDIMSILFSGDFHSNTDRELSLVTKSTLIQKYTQAKFDKIKYHIILGDAGFLWPGNHRTDLFHYKTLAYRPFPVLCVIGNHEPILGMTNIIEDDIGIGEKVLLVNKEITFVAYLKRGKIYNIDGYRFLVLGGALSIDKEYRIVNRSWWEQEYWSEKEKIDLFKLLKTNNEFDYVLTHTGPNRVNQIIANPKDAINNRDKFFDEVAALNETIDGQIKCKQWFCGHWHEDFYYYDENMNRGYQYLYRQTALLSEDKIVVL